jgi:tRNA A-37 threonylcarbamoyl transferase component Bud32
VSAETPSLDSIFCAAIAIAAPEERAAYIAGACGGDAELRRQVERMVAAHFQATNLVESPPLDPEDTSADDSLEALLAELGERRQGGQRPAAVPSVPGYEVLGELGRGGMGVVYKARHTRLKRLVALKMILAGDHAGGAALERFRREAEAVARLCHPNIVQVYEVGEHDGRPFVALEYVDGGTLAARLRQRLPEPPEAARLVEALARAVAAVHRCHIIHRDLKPANVLLTADGTPKITDFGLAKQFDAAAAEVLDYPTQSGAIVGTAPYMAPEQAAGHGEPVGPLTDVYALGAILYELLTGRPPFTGETPLDTLALVCAAEPVAPHRLRPAVHRNLEVICLKCLAKSPRQRYAGAEALADDLRRFLDGRPILARPAGAAERLGRWCRRNPVVAGLTAAVFLLLAVSAGGGLLGYLREADLRAAAERQGQAAAAAEAEARDEAAKTSHLLYVASMSAAQRYWEAGDLPHLRQTLADTADHPDRGFEWAYWRRMVHLDHLTLRGHDGAVTAVAFAPDGRSVLTGGADGTVRAWAAATGRPLRTLTGFERPVAAVAVAPQGGRVAAAGADGRVRLWDGEGRPLRTLDGHAGGATGLAFFPDGRRLVSGGADGAARVWDLAGGRPTLTIAVPGGALTALALSRDGTRLATGGADGTVRVWDAATGRPAFTRAGRAESATQGRHVGAVHALAFHPLGTQVASAGEDREVKLWDLATGKAVLLLKRHAWDATAVAFSPTAGAWSRAAGTAPPASA